MRCWATRGREKDWKVLSACFYVFDLFYVLLCLSVCLYLFRLKKWLLSYTPTRTRLRGRKKNLRKLQRHMKSWAIRGNEKSMISMEKKDWKVMSVCLYVCFMVFCPFVCLCVFKSACVSLNLSIFCSLHLSVYVSLSLSYYNFHLSGWQTVIFVFSVYLSV